MRTGSFSCRARLRIGLGLRFRLAAGRACGRSLVLAGGTVIDVTNWGHSAHDIPNAIVVIRDGRIHRRRPARRSASPQRRAHHRLHGKIPHPRPHRRLCRHELAGPGQRQPLYGRHHRRRPRRLSTRLHRFQRPTQPAHLPHRLDRRHRQLEPAGAPVRNGSRSCARVPHPAELSPEDTARQMADTAQLGTRVLLLTALSHRRQFPVDHRPRSRDGPRHLRHLCGHALPRRHRGRRRRAAAHGPLRSSASFPTSCSARSSTIPTAPRPPPPYDYSERIPPTDLRLRNYAHFLATHHAALMPTFSLYYVELPGHRNLWKEPAAALLDPGRMFHPTDPATGEMIYPLPPGRATCPPPASAGWKRICKRKPG